MEQNEKHIALPAGPTRRQIIIGSAITYSSVALFSTSGWATAAEEEISHTAEAIHQEPILKANRKRVYQALTEAREFSKVVALSDAMKSGMSPNMKPTEIFPQAGSAFSLFGGYVTGRQIELVPDTRVVQAWRAGSWEPGVYSIAAFELADAGTGTKIVFDHRGFPKGTAEHLAMGWKLNYWEPLAKYLG